MKLLLIEDDFAMRTTLERTFTRRGMEVHLCSDGALALAQWQDLRPDVVVLDLTLPGMDGLTVLRNARARGLSEPVLLLTARGMVGDRVIGLNAGADDYLPKPFDLDELIARLRALVRRHPLTGEAPPSPMKQVGKLSLEQPGGAICHDGETMELTPREQALLRTLMERPGQAVSKERLFEQVFPDQREVHYEAIEVVVYRLRKKLVGTGAALLTLRGLGYLLRAEP